MNILFSYNLERPVVFFILSVVFLIGILFLSFTSKNKNIVDTSLLLQVYKKSSYWQTLFYILIVSISFGCIILISGLYATSEKQVVKKDGIDIQIVLDVSYSMIAEDIKPTRIAVAKQMLSRFVGEIYSDRVGIILFSGKPFQSVPLTFDYKFLQDFLSKVSVDIVNQSTNDELAGTALGDGLILASDVLSRDYPEREKVIILITDGEANKGVEPELALRLLKDQGIKTYTIGVGKLEETTISVQRGNFMQEIKIGGVDEDILRKISMETDAQYFKADSDSTFQKILERIAMLEKTDLEYEIYKNRQSKNGGIIIVILFMLVALQYLYFYKNIKI